MAAVLPLSPLLPTPTADDLAALATAAAYLSHASTALATHLLGLSTSEGERVLALAVQESIDAAAVLCADLARTLG